jgi:hypothetical protein
MGLVGLPGFELGISCDPNNWFGYFRVPAKENSSEIWLLKREAPRSYRIDYSGFTERGKIPANY